jgi:coenzyme PQQ precursor peptide PqqA
VTAFNANVIGVLWRASPHLHQRSAQVRPSKKQWRRPMKSWNKPQVREQEVGLEVTSYMPAEIDII